MNRAERTLLVFAAIVVGLLWPAQPASAVPEVWGDWTWVAYGYHPIQCAYVGAGYQRFASKLDLFALDLLYKDLFCGHPDNQVPAVGFVRPTLLGGDHMTCFKDNWDWNPPGSNGIQSNRSVSSSYVLAHCHSGLKYVVGEHQNYRGGQWHPYLTVAPPTYFP